MTIDSEIILIQSRDYWFKIVDFLQQNWALIDAVDEGCVIWFFSDTSGVFDELRFQSAGEANAALRRNGFGRFEEDRKAAGFLNKPNAPFIRCPHPNGPIYSSGRFWVSTPRPPSLNSTNGVNSTNGTGLHLLPCIDSAEHAELCQQQLNIPRHLAAQLGVSAVHAAQIGTYVMDDGREIDWHLAVESASAAKQSIPPGASLPNPDHHRFAQTEVHVVNETTFSAAQRLISEGKTPLALNFANGIQPGGGFLHGARAQEEVLCRSSALYRTLLGDPMYEHHRARSLPDSTEWSILSPDVPVFRRDDGTVHAQPWLLSILTCAAPYAPTVGQPASGDLLQRRILRILTIARAFDYDSLVLGAWGCGAFGNDPHRTAADFRSALENEFRGAFAHVVFAVTDWSPERRFLGPFRDVFSA